MIEIYKLIKDNEKKIQFYLPKVLELFNKNYRQYHYLEELKRCFKDKDSRLFLAEYNSNVVGFGVLKWTDYCNGLLSSLLVDKSFRNLGIGRKIDKLRFREYLTNKKMNNLYASCVATSISNQKLKEEKGMIPIGFRYCYRKGVKFENEFGHSIFYFHSKLNWKKRNYVVTTQNKQILSILFKELAILGIEEKNILVQDCYKKIEKSKKETDIVTKIIKKRGIIKIDDKNEIKRKYLKEIILDFISKTDIVLLEINSINPKIDDILNISLEMGFFFSGINFNNNSSGFLIVLQYISEEKLINIDESKIRLFDKARRIKEIVDKSRLVL